MKIGLRGNIQDKVSFLTLQSLSLEIRNEPLNIENLRFLDSVINSKSQMIQVIHFIVSEVSHESIIKNSQSKIKVSQYSIEESYDYDRSNYRISFEQNQWNILRGNDNNYSPFFENAPSYVPYNLCDRLTLIMKSHLFDLHVDNNQITVAKPVNITLLSFEDLDNSHLLEDKNYAVQITTSGNWDGIKEATSVYFTAHQNQVTLDTRECNSKVKIEKYDFKNLPVELPPISIEDETTKENVGIGEVKIDSNKPEEIKKNIEDLFKEKNTTSNKQVDHVITIESDPNQEIVFEDLHLESNQYLKVDNNANIKLASGQLNLVLDEHSSQVNINVEKSNDVKLAFKNMDKCLVTIDTGSEEKKNITISSNSEVYGPLQIEAGKNVEHIEIDSINLHKSGSLSSTVPITVNNIAAQPQTSGKLTKVVVSKEFSISQSAVLELDEVSLSSAKINVNLHSYSSSYYDVPILNGTLGDPPSSIALINSQDVDSKPQDGQEYLLFKGIFTNKCEDWKNKINFDNSNFNEGACRDLNSLETLQEEKTLKVFYNVDKKQENDNKLSAGQIAGIVIGCVAGVAIIVAVVVIVIIKKKRSQLSTDEYDNDGQQNDL